MDVAERYPKFPKFSHFEFFPFLNFSHFFLSFGALSQAIHGPGPKGSEGTFMPKNNF